MADETGKISVEVQQLVLPVGSLKNVSVLAAIDDGLLRISPLSIPFGGGMVKTLAHLDLAAPSLAGNLQTDIQHVDLDEAMVAFGREDADSGPVSGRIALSLPAERQRTDDFLRTDLLLDRMRIEDVHLHYDDPALQGKANVRLTADSLTSGMNHYRYYRISG